MLSEAVKNLSFLSAGNEKENQNKLTLNPKPVSNTLDMKRRKYEDKIRKKHKVPKKKPGTFKSI